MTERNELVHFAFMRSDGLRGRERRSAVARAVPAEIISSAGNGGRQEGSSSTASGTIHLASAGDFHQ